MKGYLASLWPSKNGYYSDIQVLESGAGFFIGTLFTHTSGDYKGMTEPGSRESVEYYSSRKAAQKALVMNSWNQKKQP